MEHLLTVTILRYLSDDPQPGIVECELIDADGRRHTFIDKTAIFSTHNLDSKSAYPQNGIVACEIVTRWNDPLGRELVRINTTPWGVESTEGLSEFEVLAEHLSK
jgi:hypothetical protein